MMSALATRPRLYWPLTKPLQTGLLLATGLTGYMSARCPVTHIGTLLSLAGSLRLLGVLSTGLLLLAIAMTFWPSDRVTLGLFKHASV
jgi:hypothetical protein